MTRASMAPGGSEKPVNPSKLPKGTIFGAPNIPSRVPKGIPKAPRKVKQAPKKQSKPVKYNISKVANKQMGRNYS